MDLKDKTENTARSKPRKTLFAIAFTLLLTIASLFACLPIAAAQKTETTACLSLRSNPIGVNQELLVNAWTIPTPPYNTSAATVVPIGGFYPVIPRNDYMFTFTDPQGNVDTVGPFTSYEDGTIWFIYVPDQVGTWAVEFTWPGDDKFTAASAMVQLVVQQDPIPSWPKAELPTEQWTYPINPENKEWAEIAGGYWEPTTFNGRGYDSSGSRFNPYTRAPNSAHVLWKLEPVSGMAGLVGQPYGQLLTGTATSAAVDVIMLGRGYYQTKGMIHCIDVTTGEELWTINGSYTLGTIEGASSTEMAPVLLDFGPRLVKYDALTGAEIYNIANVPGWGFMDYIGTQYLGFVNPCVYMNQNSGNNSYLLKIDTSGTETDLADRIVWNVSFFSNLNNLQDTGIVLDGKTLGYLIFDDYGDSGAVDLETGNILWHRPMDDVEQKPESVTSGNGNMYFAIRNRHFNALNLRTGEVEWVSEETAYPWGTFWSYGQAFAYDQVYALSYAGVYAFDAETGEINWHYSAGNSGLETPYGTWPFGSIDPIVADGKIFAPASEHSPTFYYRGERLHVINAYSGDRVWSVMGYWTPTAVAQDKLFATNTYDGDSYCFGKGETATTVSVSSKVTAKGSSVLIEGSVLDMSPAQEGTVAISDDSMSAWMEYLHMQQPKPTNATGVSVHLTAVDPNGGTQEIGTVTTDIKGNYVTSWAPTVSGVYKIVATFAGSESYYRSDAETGVVVSSAESASPVVTSPSPSPAVQPPSSGMPTETYIAVGAVVVVVVAVAAVFALRKRK